MDGWPERILNAKVLGVQAYHEHVGARSCISELIIKKLNTYLIDSFRKTQLIVSCLPKLFNETLTTNNDLPAEKLW